MYSLLILSCFPVVAVKSATVVRARGEHRGVSAFYSQGRIHCWTRKCFLRFKVSRLDMLSQALVWIAKRMFKSMQQISKCFVSAVQVVPETQVY